MAFDKSWYDQHQDKIPLENLTDYWQHNHTFMTPDKSDIITERCADEYWDLSRRESPELAAERDPDAPILDISEQAMSDWHEKQSKFFAVVEDIEKYDYRKQPHTPGWTPRSVLGQQFGEWFPEYIKYRTDTTLEKIRPGLSNPSELLTGFDVTYQTEAISPFVAQPGLDKPERKPVVQPSKIRHTGRDVSDIPDIAYQDGQDAGQKYQD